VYVEAWLIQFPRPGTGELFVQICLIVMLALGSPTAVLADSHQPASDQDLPSEAMLEFLGDLEPVDEETWQLLEQHALRDVAQNKEVNSE
jgi:hypothetical protein